MQRSDGRMRKVTCSGVFRYALVLCGRYPGARYQPPIFRGVSASAKNMGNGAILDCDVYHKISRRIVTFLCRRVWRASHRTSALIHRPRRIAKVVRRPSKSSRPCRLRRHCGQPSRQADGYAQGVGNHAQNQGHPGNGDPSNRKFQSSLTVTKDRRAHEHVRQQVD